MAAATHPYTKATHAAHVKEHRVSVPHADIAVFISTPKTASAALPSGKPRPIIFLQHGNSASSLIFRPFFDGPLADTHTIVAMDLPGHGASSNAHEQLGLKNVYRQPGYARAIIAVLDNPIFQASRDAQSGMLDVVFLGWSLGGHIGIELCEILSTEKDRHSLCVRALVLVGTPPIPHQGGDLGFYPPPPGGKRIMATEVLTHEEISAAAKGMVATGYEDWMLDAVARTDGRARDVMFSSLLSGDGTSDQKIIVERLTADEDPATIVAVINGDADAYIKTRWIAEGVNWGPGLWRGECLEVEGAGHTVFWERWEEFWGLFKDLIRDVEGKM